MELTSADRDQIMAHIAAALSIAHQIWLYRVAIRLDAARVKLEKIFQPSVEAEELPKGGPDWNDLSGWWGRQLENMLRA